MRTDTGVGYGSPTPDTEFDVLEGARKIGRGLKISRWRM